MAKFCPNCKTHVDVNALSCSCGHVFVEDIELTRSAQLEHINHLRKDRVVKRTIIFTCCAAFALAFAAWFGGFISTAPVVADSDISKQTGTKPLIDVPQPQTASLIPRFPENNVPYMAVKAVTGAVFEVTDAAGQDHRVSIHGIRVPKMDENFGFESRASLSTFVMGKPIMIKLRRFTKDVDTIAEVFADGSNIGLEQVRSGMAWLVPEEIAGLSEPEQKDYLDAAIAAKSSKYGLWSGKKGVNPLTGEAGDWNAAPIQMDAPGVTDAPPTASYREPRVKTPSSFVNKRTDARVVENRSSMPEPVNVSPPVERSPVYEPKEASPAPVVRPKPAPSKRTFMRGPFGGCYYINSSGNKSYVDRSACD